MNHNYIVTQRDIQLIKQKNKKAYLKAQILNRDKEVIETFEESLKDISVTIDANSENRRSCNITLHPKNSSYYELSSNGKFWYNRFIKIYLGLYHNLSKEIVWYTVGTFLIDEDTFNFSAENGEVTISCKDLYNLLNGTESGSLFASETKIPAGKVISKALIQILVQLAGINDYVIGDMGRYYSIDYYIDLIAKNNNLLPTMDEDGNYNPYNETARRMYERLSRAKADANNEYVICIPHSSYDEDDVVVDSELYDFLFPDSKTPDSILYIKLDEDNNRDMIYKQVLPNTILRDEIFSNNDFENMSVIIFVPDVLETPDDIFNIAEWSNETNEEIYYYMVASFKSIIEVPYTLEYTESNSVGDMVTELKDLYPCWEAFFDENGTFVTQMIPTSKNDITVLDASIMNSLYIDVSPSYRLSDVKNAVKIVGANIEPERYTDNTAVETTYTTADTYVAYIDNFYNYTVNQYIGIKVPKNNTSELYLKVIGKNTDSSGKETEVVLGTFPVHSLATKTFYPENTFQTDEIYVFYYSYNRFYCIGQFEATGMAILVEEEPSNEIKNEHKIKYNCNNISYVVDPDSPFCVEKIGFRYAFNPDMEVTGVNYDSITSDSLALENAEYMLYKLSSLKDTINIQTLIIPFLDVNQKIEFTNPLTKKTDDYIINSINYTLADGTMQISARRFTELYPSEQKEEKCLILINNFH